MIANSRISGSNYLRYSCHIYMYQFSIATQKYTYGISGSALGLSVYIILLMQQSKWHKKIYLVNIIFWSITSLQFCLYWWLYQAFKLYYIGIYLFISYCCHYYHVSVFLLSCKRALKSIAIMNSYKKIYHHHYSQFLNAPTTILVKLFHSYIR